MRSKFSVCLLHVIFTLPYYIVEAGREVLIELYKYRWNTKCDDGNKISPISI